MPRHGNQTLINIMQKKSEPIASDSPRFMLKLIEDQGCKYYDKKFGLFVRKLSFSWSKNRFFIFCTSGVIYVWMCSVESFPPWAINQKICLVRIGLSKTFWITWLKRIAQPSQHIFQWLWRRTHLALFFLKLKLSNDKKIMGIKIMKQEMLLEAKIASI